MVTIGAALTIFAISYQVSITEHKNLRKRQSILIYILAVVANVIIGVHK